jgi:hypothetical protein
MFQQFHLCINKRIKNTSKYWYTHVHNSQKVETNEMSIKECMNKQNVMYPNKGILFNLKMELNLIYATTWMNTDVKWNKVDTKGQIL